MVKKILATGLILSFVLVTAQTAGTREGNSVSYEQCVRNCQQAYQGNPKAIQACIDRCR